MDNFLGGENINTLQSVNVTPEITAVIAVLFSN